MNNTYHSDFFQTSERMLAELGFELTTPGLTTRVATEWAAGARPELEIKVTETETLIHQICSITKRDINPPTFIV